MILPPWVKTALAAAALLGTAGATWQVQEWRHAAKQADALRAQQKAFERQLARQHDIAAEYETERESARVEYITREGQVREIFREVEVPSNCAAPPAVRGVLSEAVTSANVDTP
jgi:uncharacterized protein HemX